MCRVTWDPSSWDPFQWVPAPTVPTSWEFPHPHTTSQALRAWKRWAGPHVALKRGIFLYLLQSPGTVWGWYALLREELGAICFHSQLRYLEAHSHPRHYRPHCVHSEPCSQVQGSPLPKIPEEGPLKVHSSLGGGGGCTACRLQCRDK